VFQYKVEPGKRKFIIYYGKPLATPDEILSAKMELWNKLKPTL
jgi:hypothetical protein